MSNTGSVAFSGGEAGRGSLSGDFGGHRGRFGYYAFGTIFESDRFLSPPDPEAIHDHATGGHSLFQLDVDLGQKGLLRAMVMGDGANFDIPKTPEDVELRPDANASQRTRQQTATVGWNRAASDFMIGATFYERWSGLDLLPAEDPLAARASLTRDVGTIGGKFDVTRFAGRHAIKAGFDAVRLRPDEDLFYDYSGYGRILRPCRSSST